VLVKQRKARHFELIQLKIEFSRMETYFGLERNFPEPAEHLLA